MSQNSKWIFLTFPETTKWLVRCESFLSLLDFWGTSDLFSSGHSGFLLSVICGHPSPSLTLLTADYLRGKLDFSVLFPDSKGKGAWLSQPMMWWFWHLGVLPVIPLAKLWEAGGYIIQARLQKEGAVLCNMGTGRGKWLEEEAIGLLRTLAKIFL